LEALTTQSFNHDARSPALIYVSRNSHYRFKRQEGIASP
jgi:hypothetical protein